MGKRRAEDDSSEDSSSDSSSASDSEEERRSKKHRKSEKKGKKEKKDKKKKHKSKDSRKSKKHKKAKKSKKDSKDGSKVSSRYEYGKYGIIGTQHRFAKQQEFYIWLREVKEIEPELQPPFELENHWGAYEEDYNTATLPNKKYYDLEAWEAKMQEKAAKSKKPVVDDGTAGVMSTFLKSNGTRAGGGTQLTKSRRELEEMRDILRARNEQAVKKDLGQRLDEKAGIRTQSVMRGLAGFGAKIVP